MEIDAIARARAIEHEEAAHMRAENARRRTRASFMEHRAALLKAGMTKEQIAMGMKLGLPSPSISHSIDLAHAHRPDCWIGMGVVEVVSRKLDDDISEHVFVSTNILRRFRDLIGCGECKRLFIEDTIRAIKMAKERDE
jgi:hypothetical protein